MAHADWAEEAGAVERWWVVPVPVLESVASPDSMAPVAKLRE